jgi:hypothetical protein
MSATKVKASFEIWVGFGNNADVEADGDAEAKVGPWAVAEVGYDELEVPAEV